MSLETSDANSRRPPDRDNVGQHEDTVRRFIASHRRRWILQRVAAQVQVTWTVAFVLCALTQAGFSLFPWVGFPLIGDAIVAAAILVTCASFVNVAVVHPPSLASTARRLEEANGGQHQLLCLALDFAATPDLIGQPLTREALRRSVESLGAYPKRHRFVTQPPLWAVSGAVVVCALTLGLLRPSVAHYWDLPFARAGTTELLVTPGTVNIARGRPVTLSLDIKNRRPPSCDLQIRGIEREPLRGRHLLRPDSTGRFSLRIDSALTSFVYGFRVGTGPATSDTIRVVQPPGLYKLRVTITPPKYVGLPPRHLGEGQGSFSAYAGSEVTCLVGSLFPLKRVWLVGQSGDSTPLTIEAGEGRGGFTVQASMRYTFALHDSLGQLSGELPSFLVNLIPDLPPRAHILRPAQNKALTPAQSETLWVEGVDDIGIRRLAVEWRRRTDFADTSGSWDLSPPGSPQREVRRALAWDLRPLGMYPGDTVFYWAVARDSKPFGPPQIAASDTFWFRVPSFTEIHREVAASQEATVRNLSDVATQQDRLKEEVSQLVSSAKGEKALTWEEKQVVSDLAEQITAQRDSLHKAVEQLQETAEKLRDQGLSNQSILDKMELVRKAVEKLIRDYGDSTLFQPPKPGEEVGWQDIRDALKKLEEALPDLQEQLDNTLKYLDQLRRDQELAALAARAEHLGDVQRETAELRAPDPERLRRQRDATAEQEKFLDDIEQRLQGDSADALFAPGDLPSLGQARTTSESMRQSLDRQRMPQNGDMTAMSGSLSALAEEIRSNLSSTMMQRAQKEAGMILDMAYDALTLSQWQQTNRESAGIAPQAPAAADAIRSQQALRQALGSSREMLDSLSTPPPGLLLDISRKFDTASVATGDVLDAMKSSSGASQMGQGVASLNDLSHTLLEASAAMEQAMQGQPGQTGQGMMSGLRKLSGKQAAVNSATSEMLRAMLSGQGSEKAGAGAADGPARRSAQAAQQAIADKLRELADTYGKEAGAGMEEKVNELQQEAQRLARMLDSPSQEVNERQERFLVRMLQSSLSMHKQDEGKEERKSQAAAQTFAPSGTAPSSLGEYRADQFYLLRARAMRGNFPGEYRPAIEAYLDTLESAVTK